MVVAGLEELPDLSVRLLEADTENETHSEKKRAAEVLMSGRTDTDDGVSGSINLSQNDKVYDVLIDFGKVIDIPAVEILWEGACPQRYSLSVGREADFSDAQTVDHFAPMRRAMVDRPRFDRFAVRPPKHTKLLRQKSSPHRSQAAPKLPILKTARDRLSAMSSSIISFSTPGWAMSGAQNSLK